MKNRWYHYLKPPVIGDLLNRPNEKVRRRSFRVKMLYAFIYPFSSGIVIYAGLMTFSVVVTNVTGLLPQMARDLYSGNLTTAGSIFGWLFAFFLGGFFAGWCVEREKLLKWRYLHLLPLAVVAGIFTFVGSSADNSSVLHPVAFPGMMLFSIGIQNAMVSLTTSSLIKASQMTGVVNELGVDIAEIFHSEGEKRRVIQREALLRLIVMVSFLTGAMFSVGVFPHLQTRIFFVPAGIIAAVMIYDIWRFKTTDGYVSQN
ncbi:MAG: DUF1275 domain-containing protein [Saprospiraceae bacterium]|nr:DUF1275 domain-containing protein [Saprospiraceae bacterium]